MRSAKYHLLMLLDRLCAAFEGFAEEVLGSFTDELWHAIEGERPVWPEVVRWLQGLCGSCATPWQRPLLHRLTVRRCKWCREEESSWDKLVAELRRRAEAEGGPMFMGRPDRWWDDYTVRCVNGHVSTTALRTNRGDVCLACRGAVRLTFSEDTDGPLNQEAP